MKKDNSPKVGVVIVNYNGFEYTAECVKSILASSYDNLDVIVVDNASTDGSVEKLGDLFRTEITLLRSEKNIGFAGGTNIGIKTAVDRGCEFVLLLNNDTIVDEFLIQNMVHSSIENGNALIAPKIFYFDESDVLWFAGGFIDWKKGIGIHYGMNCQECDAFNVQKEIDFATGCCILVPKKTFDNVGLLDEAYFLYFEDTDFSVRVKRAGMRIVYEPSAVLWHKVSSTTGRGETKVAIYYGDRNRLFFNRKFNNKHWFEFSAYFALSRILKILIWALHGEFWKIRLLYLAISDFLSGKMGNRENL
jgi:GT2 family glycosyltransferase